MKKAGLIAVFALLFFATPVMARSGCCSWHDGVRADGCGCNDGTPLSSTCAPYYVCTANEPAISSNTSNSSPALTPYPTQYPISIPPKTPTPKPTLIPTKTPSPTITPTPTLSPTETLTPTPIPSVLEPKKEIKSETNRNNSLKNKTFWDYFFASAFREIFPQFAFFGIFEK